MYNCTCTLFSCKKTRNILPDLSLFNVQYTRVHVSRAGVGMTLAVCKKFPGMKNPLSWMPVDVKFLPSQHSPRCPTHAQAHHPPRCPTHIDAQQYALITGSKVVHGHVSTIFSCMTDPCPHYPNCIISIPKFTCAVVYSARKCTVAV